MPKKTFSAQSPFTGKAFTRKTEREYTHAMFFRYIVQEDRVVENQHCMEDGQEPKAYPNVEWVRGELSKSAYVVPHREWKSVTHYKKGEEYFQAYTNTVISWGDCPSFHGSYAHAMKAAAAKQSEVSPSMKEWVSAVSKIVPCVEVVK